MVRSSDIKCEYCENTIKLSSWSKHLHSQKHLNNAKNYRDETDKFPLLQSKEYISKLAKIDQPSVLKRDKNGHIFTLKRNPAYVKLITDNYNLFTREWETHYPGDVLMVRVDTTEGTSYFEASHSNVLNNIILRAIFGEEVGHLSMGSDTQPGSDIYTLRISFSSMLKSLNREKDKYISELNEAMKNPSPSPIMVETREKLRSEISRIDRRISGVGQRSRGSYFPYSIMQCVIDALDRDTISELRNCQIYSEKNYNDASVPKLDINSVLDINDNNKWFLSMSTPCLQFSLSKLGINIQHLVERDLINHLDHLERRKDDIIKISNEMEGFGRDLYIIVKSSAQHYVYILPDNGKAFKRSSMQALNWEDGVLVLKENHFFTVFSRDIFNLITELIDNKETMLNPVTPAQLANIKNINFIKHNNREISKEDLELSLTSVSNTKSSRVRIEKSLKELHVQNYDFVYIADGECTVNTPFDDKGSFLHINFAAGLAQIDINKKEVIVSSYQEFTGLRCGYQILKYLSDKHKSAKRIKILFHNSKYDLTTIFYGQKTIGAPLKKDGNVYCASYSLAKGQKIDVLDSFKFLPFALYDLGPKFKSRFHKKETIVYEKYTLIPNAPDFAKGFHEMLLPSEKNQLVSDYYFDGGKIAFNAEDSKYNELFDENTKKMKIAEESGYIFSQNCQKYVKAFEMYQDYLRYDVLCLGEVMATFMKYCQEITGDIPLFRKMSTSGYFSAWASDTVVDIEPLAGIADEFLNKALQGGRVFCNEATRGIVMEEGKEDIHNTRLGFSSKILGRKALLDKVSLYPSAIKEICDEGGFAKEFPVMIEDNRFDEILSSGLYYVVKILITKVNRTWDQGIIRRQDGDKIRYGNIAPSEPVILCKTDLEEYIKYHEIEYQFIFGMYYPNGYGGKELGDKIDHLFNKRLEAKAEKNDPLQETVKLGMNSIFGSHLLNIEPVETVLIKASELNSFIYNNQSRYISHEVSSKGYHAVKLYDINCENKSKKIIGIEILARAKRIVNRVIFLIQSLGYRVYYSDTDSIWVDSKILKELEVKYEFVYRKKLVGKNFGQLHPDAQIKYGDEKIDAEIEKCLFLESKSYIANLVVPHPSIEGENIYGYKTGMKGVSKRAQTHTANHSSEKESIRDRVFETFERTMLPGGVKFILNPSEIKKVAFDYTVRIDEDGNEIPCVITRPENSFFRNIEFN